MSFITCRTAITDELKLYTGSPPMFPENITVPATAQGSPWVRWSIRPADAFDSCVGADFERIIGTVYFQHFIPEGAGTKAAWDFCDKIGALLNSKSVGFSGGSMLFQRAKCQYIGILDGLVQHNITIEFREDAVALNA